MLDRQMQFFPAIFDARSEFLGANTIGTCPVVIMADSARQCGRSGVVSYWW